MNLKKWSRRLRVIVAGMLLVIGFVPITLGALLIGEMTLSDVFESITDEMTAGPMSVSRTLVDAWHES